MDLYIKLIKWSHACTISFFCMDILILQIFKFSYAQYLSIITIFLSTIKKQSHLWDYCHTETNIDVSLVCYKKLYNLFDKIISQ